jgi:protein-L-isoaspartate(D-aspartate) O-methyltransferase
MIFLLLVLTGCSGPSRGDHAAMEQRFVAMRETMISTQIAARGVTDPRVLEAMRQVPRHRFVPEEYQKEAYEDYPLPIGEGQTISQPYIVAFMTEILKVEPGQKVLEIGTGSGYQAAVLAAMGAEVTTIEILPSLAERAQARLAEVGYGGVRVMTGDGYRGYPAGAPYDAIIVTAAPERIPEPLIEQLAVGGRLVVPIGRYTQELKLLSKTADGATVEDVLPVRFVPMVGEVEK